MAFAYFHKTTGGFQFVLQEQEDFPWNDCFDVGAASNGDWFDLVDGVPVLNPQKSVVDDGSFQAELLQQQQTQYQRDRQSAYPSIGDQLDALWKGGAAATEMLARVQAVKNQFPKPGA